MSAASVQSLVLLLLALGTGGWGMLVARRWPGAATVGYLTVLMLVPAWLVLPLGPVVPLPMIQVVGLALIVAMFGMDTVRPTVFDVVLLGFAVLLVFVGVFGLVDANSLYWLLMWWVLPYLVARTLAARGQVATVYDTVTVLVVVVAVLAVVESVMNYNFFVDHLGVGSDWERLQYRGGRVRVEGAFGHSIALGAVLGMSVPLVWASRWRPWFRVLALALVGVATMLTFSRIGMLTMMLALAASFVLLRTQMPARVRWTVLGVGAVVALVLVPTVMRVFDDASDEVTGTADYRVFLLSLVPKLAVFGEATSPTVYLDSIDNELVLTGVRFGLMPLAFLLLCAFVGVVLAVRRRPNPGLVAVMVMLPGLTSVAFITQFTAFFWFAVGIGVSTLTAGQDGTGQAAAAPTDAAGEAAAEDVGEPVAAAHVGARDGRRRVGTARPGRAVPTDRAGPGR